MITAPLYKQSTELRHIRAEEYAEFIHTHYDPGSAKHFLYAHADFVGRYPNLSEWMQLPLVERIGRTFRQSKKDLSNPISYHARSYLYYLVFRDCLRLDWEWLIAVPTLNLRGLLKCSGVKLNIDQLVEEAVRYGYDPRSSNQALVRVINRIVLHTGKRTIEEITDQDCHEFREAVYAFSKRSDVSSFFGSDARYYDLLKAYTTSLTCLHVVLFHRGQATTEPRKIMPFWKARPPIPPQMEEVLQKYEATRRLTDMPETAERLVVRIRRFVIWLTNKDPLIETFAEVNREHILEFAEALKTMTGERTGTPYTALTRRGYLSALSVFFRDVASWGWEHVPPRPLMGIGDLPKMPYRVPRFIPDDELERLMTAIRTLECPYQRAALLIARWSGARAGEIRRLEADCLDSYSDSTPRLRIPAGKTKKERMIPINDEAAEAIRRLQALRQAPRGFRDSHTGKITHYLFVDYGKRLSGFYLFDSSLRRACESAGLLTADGKPTITPHRFRHTVGTQLAEKGAKLHTIMKILGHSSASMSMVYAQISDREVLKDYQSVLSPGAVIAGPCAEDLRSGQMPQSSIDWLKTNFFKTELELGHCLRLPQEGPCECDLYLSCAKFVTTPEYAPRLRRRRKQEFDLIEDARQRGWDKEVERHRCTVNRIDQLLKELGEPIEGQEAVY
jgi:integrase